MSERLRLAARIWRELVRATWLLRTRPLPSVIAHARRHPAPVPRYPAPALGRAVHRALGVGRVRPRCLTQSMVLFSLLTAQGDEADVVIGIPPGSTKRAHAWIELAGTDVGPPPGRLGSTELARFA